MSVSFTTRLARKLRSWGLLPAAALCALAMLSTAPAARAQAPLGDAVKESPETKKRRESLITDMIDAETTLKLDPRRSKLIRTSKPVSRFSVTNPETVEIVQFSPTEFELVGGAAGETTLTLWFGDPAERVILRYLVRVGVDQAKEDQKRIEYGDLQDKINEFFPNSSIQLIPIADKLIVRGQARDGEEASQILAMLGSQSTDQTGRQLFGGGGFGRINVGQAVQPYAGISDLPASNLINMLDVPGEMQIMLKVRVAELVRSSERVVGANFSAMSKDNRTFQFMSNLAAGGAFSAILTTDEVNLAFGAQASNSYSKILAEPNLVTLNGKPASFNAGGEFAVPTAVGVEGVGAVSTSFRGFGTSIQFTPVVIDKDRFRLTVSPTISAINTSNAVGGVPGLTSRSVNTTVDLREGQWLAIAGLIEDDQNGSKVRVPFLGDIPVLDTIFSKRSITRSESELIILVSPELVHPLEPEEVPLLLPGMEITEPSDWKFYLSGYYVGDSRCDHRSTVWPEQRLRMLEGKQDALKACKSNSRYQRSEKYYVSGCHGFSE